VGLVFNAFGVPLLNNLGINDIEGSDTNSNRYNIPIKSLSMVSLFRDDCWLCILIFDQDAF
jgi:hypothetical protein